MTKDSKNKIRKPADFESHLEKLEKITARMEAETTTLNDCYKKIFIDYGFFTDFPF